MDNNLLLLDPRDTVMVARARILAGSLVSIDGQPYTTLDDVPMGHKLARTTIRTGDPIVKYGAPIGRAVADIAVGAHVHVHNIKSDYTPTYTLDAARARAG